MNLRVAVAPLVGLISLAFLTAFKDGPTPGVAGGFGDGTCHACHYDNPLNAPGGALRIAGVPKAYSADRTYQISIEVARTGMLSGGFQIAARFAAGPQQEEQAGAWELIDARTQTVAATNPALFVTHTQNGATLSERDAVAWTFRWAAPAQSRWPVQFNVAANAANDDASQLGDFIYTFEQRVPPTSASSSASSDN